MKKIMSVSKQVIFIWIIIGLAMVASVNSQPQTRPQTQNQCYWLQHSQRQEQNFLSDNYNYFVTYNGNKVWAGALTLAWQQFKENYANNESILLKDTNNFEDKILSNFNNAEFNKENLDQKSYYVRSGFGQSTVDKINREVEAKFPQKEISKLEVTLQQDDIISYAYFFKKFDYPIPFKKCKIFQFNNKIVDGFQAANEKQKNQIYYKYYRSNQQFMVGIETKSNDQIILIKAPLEKTKNGKSLSDLSFQKAIDLIQISEKMKKKRLDSKDVFKMPAISFDFKRSIHQLVQKGFLNDDLKEMQISEIIQSIKLEVTQTGVKMENQGTMISSRSFFNFGIKQFILNREFWLVLKEKGKLPYLVAKVMNPVDKWINK